jgi:hypothetical protein
MRRLVALAVSSVIAAGGVYLAVVHGVGVGLTTVILAFAVVAGLVIVNYDTIERIKALGVDVKRARQEVADAKNAAIEEIQRDVQRQKDEIGLLLEFARRTREERLHCSANASKRSLRMRQQPRSASRNSTRRLNSLPCCSCV